MLAALIIPAPEAPRPIDGYGMPARPMLDWPFVAERMIAARYYWINTTDADPSAPQPHAAPLWGVWYADRAYFGGSLETRWARNLLAQPAIAVHPPDAENVVIIEGVARPLRDDDLPAAARDSLDRAYRDKYGVDDGAVNWVVEPRLVLAWEGANLTTTTRWRFR